MAFAPSLAAQQPPKTLLVAGASDLAAVHPRIAAIFQKSHGLALRFTFGSSGMLAQQIAHGAPYDVFLSADERRVSELAASGHLDPASVTVYATGRLAIWSKSGKFEKLADLAGPGVRHVAIANPAHAPYGAAAQQALLRAGLWQRLAGRIVFAESVRHAFEYASSGNAEVALTAWSLVIDKGGFLVPAESHLPIRQSGGVVRNSAHQEAGRALLRFLVGPEGQELLAGSGFSRIR